jgi:Domain of unknown function (DUF4398)
MFQRPIALACALIAALTVAGCGSPPDKEIQQAQGAVDAAKVIGAPEYAAEEFTAAENALKNANEAVVQRDYRLALNHALDARDRAQTAAKQTAERKSVLRVGADRAIMNATRALTDASAMLKATESNRNAPRSIVESRRSVVAAEQALQEARTDLERGHYQSAEQHANTAASRAQAVARDLDPRTTPAPRRRR